MTNRTDYWALLATLNLPSIYKLQNQSYSLATHGSHTVNGVQLIPGAPGFNPQAAYGLWVSLLTVTVVPTPTLSLSAGETGFTVDLNVAGALEMSVSGSLGNFAAGTTLLSEQSSVKEGLLTLSAGGKSSTATSQYVVLGTSGNDNIDFSAQASRVDYIFGGAGADTILGGAGDDVIHGGTGNDTITSGAGNDTLFGGDGDDKFRYLQSNDLQSGTSLADSINGGAGTNTLVIGSNIGTSFQIVEAMSWSRMGNVSRIEAVGPFTAQYNLVFNNDAHESGLRVIDLSADTDGAFNANFINVAAETGSTNGYTLVGSAGTDFITGGAGNDTITGGSGDDTISGGTGIDRLSGGGGQDKFQQNQGDSAFVDDSGSTIANRTANGYLANGDKLKFPNGQIDVVTDFDSATDVVDASAIGANSTDGRMWKDFIRGQGHYAKGNWDGSELFTIDYATGRDILYFVSLNGSILAFNAFGGCAEFCVNGQSTAGASRPVRKHNERQETRRTRRTAVWPAGQLQEA